MPQISQSSLIVFYLFAAFIVFITVRGELSTYVGFFVGGSAPAPQSGGNATAQNSGDALSSAQTLLLEGAQLALIA